ncbi:MAG TPA: hypothetical protein VFE54_11145, partial [Mucilaginibacter sp.]|nr:hypothetical protein [Mucilaginibacter sp.]
MNTFGQTGPPGLTTVVQPSPNMQAMQKYGDMPVSAYTGIPDISIPLYTIKFHDISIPISLSYHASGIKVQEEATDVGLGWVLNAGGSISRNIIGTDDFFITNGYFNGGTIDPITGNFTLSSTTASDFDNGLIPIGVVQTTNSCSIAFRNTGGSGNEVDFDIHNGSKAGSPIVDYQPDVYNFSFPGKSGKFVLDRSYNAILEKQEKVSIKCMAVDGSAWRITSVDGFIYDYTVYETYNDYGYPSKHKTAWYLTKITSPTGNYVTYNYAGTSDFFQSSVGEYSDYRDDWQIPQTPPFTTPRSLTPTTTHTLAPGKVYSSLRITSIDYNDGQIQFNYTGGSDNSRLDLPGGFILNTVNVFSKDVDGNLSYKPIKTYTLSHGYFVGSSNVGFLVSSSTISSNRLKLLSVTESGNYNDQPVTNNPYTFTYYESATGYYDLPDKSSFGRDNWGYSNGYLGATSLVPNFIFFDNSSAPASKLGVPGSSRSSNAAYMPSFSLMTITYPTGGTTRFDYEANDCDEQLSETNDQSGNPYLYTFIPQSYAGYTWTQGQTFSAPTLDNRNAYSSAKGPFSISFIFDGTVTSLPSLTTGAFVLTFTNNSTGTQYSFDPANYTYYSSPPSPTPSGPYSFYTSQSEVLTINNLTADMIPPGQYTLSLSVANTGYAAHVMHQTMSYSWYTQVNSSGTTPNAITYSTIGGLRIKRITDHDGVNPDRIKKFIYHYFADKNGDGIPEEYSYGKRMSRPEYSSWDLSYEYSTSSTGNSSYYYFGEHLIRASDSNIPLTGSAAGSVVGYDQVTELYGENGENGETVYKYI